MSPSVFEWKKILGKVEPCFSVNTDNTVIIIIIQRSHLISVFRPGRRELGVKDYLVSVGLRNELFIYQQNQ